MTIAAIAIGRNEGARLRRCLTSLVGQVDHLVYVDSGSTDDSVAFARNVGAMVVELDRSVPFTAARARNAGFDALMAQTDPACVQFVDGDCGVAPGWIAAARAALEADPGIAIVTGWRTEIAPEANAYHAMAEIEWHQPAGEIASCGGDMMVRVSAFRQVGGFNSTIIASEDEDFVVRIRNAGFRAIRLAQVMTHHDLAMTRFREWWRRNLRTGHGLAEVGDMHPPHFRPERRRAAIYGLILPAILIISAFEGWWWLTLLILAGYGASTWRVWRYLRGRSVPSRLTLPVAGLFTLAKLPHLLGMGQYYLRRLRRRTPQIIEYK